MHSGKAEAEFRFCNFYFTVVIHTPRRVMNKK